MAVERAHLLVAAESAAGGASPAAWNESDQTSLYILARQQNLARQDRAQGLYRNWRSSRMQPLRMRSFKTEHLILSGDSTCRRLPPRSKSFKTKVLASKRELGLAKRTRLGKDTPRQCEGPGRTAASSYTTTGINNQCPQQQQDAAAKTKGLQNEASDFKRELDLAKMHLDDVKAAAKIKELHNKVSDLKRKVDRAKTHLDNANVLADLSG
ncbi:unnamed protein product [Clonostachys rosea]|uniref:Uncharacterized protein n=1 Tax=Bionectria ochroleuca TaxID=29856 RepID=A0ABY6U022_BIOOC|nr:unnamed protein product [Clonostachys rosea]